MLISLNSTQELFLGNVYRLLGRTVEVCRRDGFRASDKKLRLACHASASITGCVQSTSYACETNRLLSPDSLLAIASTRTYVLTKSMSHTAA